MRIETTENECTIRRLQELVEVLLQPDDKTGLTEIVTPTNDKTGLTKIVTPKP